MISHAILLRTMTEVNTTADLSDWPYREIIAIAGGVLGFWGGVWCLGIVFLLSLMLQRSSCRKGEDRKKRL